VTDNFLHHNQLLTDRSFQGRGKPSPYGGGIPGVYTKGGTTTLAEQRVTLFYDPLDILRIEIAATNDDEILDPACNKKLLLDTKTQISGT
jgi:hypothetical protein